MVVVLLLASVSLNAETIVWQSTVYQSVTAWYVQAAYQVDDEIVIVKVSSIVEETKPLACDPIDIGAPSLIVTKCTNYSGDYEGGVLIYDINEGQYSEEEDPPTVYDYDSSLGDHWIDNPAFGWCYVEYYPWVWVDERQEWSYFMNAGTSAFDLPDNTWWIWGASTGWYWTAQNCDWIYNCTTSAWEVR